MCATLARCGSVHGGGGCEVVRDILLFAQDHLSLEPAVHVDQPVSYVGV